MALADKPRPGIRRKGNRWEVYVRVSGELHRTSFPLTTPLVEMSDWQDRQRARLAPDPEGGLAADVTRYLLTVRHMPTFNERKRHLELWVAVFGTDRDPHSITTSEIDAQLSEWRASGLAPTSVRHRRTALLHLFNKLYGDKENPVRRSWRPSDPKPEPRAIPPAVLKQILRSITGPKTRARLRVIAATGLPHKQVMLIRPEDIDWTRSRVRIAPRQKGAGAAGRWLPMNRHARFAFRALAKADAFGEFSTGAMRITWQRALKRLNLPASIRPYDVRHTAGTLLYQATRDLATVARLLGHSDPRTAARYSIEAHVEVDTAAMELLSKAYRPKSAKVRSLKGESQPAGKLPTRTQLERRKKS
jgi:integrase